MFYYKAGTPIFSPKQFKINRKTSYQALPHFLPIVFLPSCKCKIVKDVMQEAMNSYIPDWENKNTPVKMPGKQIKIWKETNMIT